MKTFQRFDPKSIVFQGFDVFGKKITLSAPLEFELVKSYDSPVRSLECVFSLEGSIPELIRLELYANHKQLFRGNVDEQICFYNHQGMQLKLSARSDGAILLDNEARPQTYSYVYLSDIFRNHIKPYGFYSLAIREDPFFNKYQILKGTSEWEVFSNFAKHALLGTIYVDDDMNFYCGSWLKPDVLISNRNPQGIPFSSLRTVNNRYATISSFVVRNKDGVYGTTYNNPEAESLKLQQRRRFLNPPLEFVQTSTAHVIDAQIRTQRSMLAKKVITVVCPELIDIEYGMTATIDDPMFRCSQWFIEQVRHRLSSNGFGTTLTVVDPKYLT